MLGIAKDSDQKAIKEAFRMLALRYHPDRNKEPGAEEKFKEIAEAYAVLSDPKKRSEYDSRGFAGVSDFSPEDLFGGINFDDIFGGFGGLGFFERLFRRESLHPKGSDFEVEINISLEKVVHGGKEEIRFRHPAVCPDCMGTGAEKGTAPEKCTACNGTGQTRVNARETKGNVIIAQIRTCPACHGRGAVIAKPCESCQGTGEMDKEESYNVTIPVGIEDGMALKLAGRGMPSPDPYGSAGDLYVMVRTRQDPRFQRQGADLWRTETISITDAVLGTTLSVPTLEDRASVNVPAGTQPDSMLRLKGKGLPNFGRSGVGDMYLKIKVSIPEKLSGQERELYERLRLISPA